jgi:hypothetical protein
MGFPRRSALRSLTIDYVSEEWIPVADAAAHVDRLEADRIPILGIELARITPDERVLLPAFADFSGCGDDETWDFARELLREHLPPDATDVNFTT